MKRTAKTHPFLVRAELPKGHIFGSKSKVTVRRNVFTTEGEARIDKDALLKSGAMSAIIINRSKK